MGSDNRVNRALPDQATKAFLLTLASVISSFLFASVVMANHFITGGDNGSVAYLSIFGFMYLLDVFINFVSIMFGYSQFTYHYMKICGVCHRKCIQFGIHEKE